MYIYIYIYVCVCLRVQGLYHGPSKTLVLRCVSILVKPYKPDCQVKLRPLIEHTAEKQAAGSAWNSV